MKELVQNIRDSIGAGIILGHMDLIDELEERCTNLNIEPEFWESSTPLFKGNIIILDGKKQEVK